MPGARSFAAAAGHLIELLPEFGDQPAHGFGVAGKIGRGGIDAGMKRHGLRRLWCAAIRHGGSRHGVTAPPP